MAGRVAFSLRNCGMGGIVLRLWCSKNGLLPNMRLWDVQDDQDCDCASIALGCYLIKLVKGDGASLP